MPYTTETPVYDRTGFNSSIIQDMSGKDSDDVTTLVEGFISDPEAQIRKDIGYPIVIAEELHLGDGNKNQWDLGPEDDEFAEEGDYDPIDGLIEVYRVKFAAKRMWKPWPEDCDEWTDYSDMDATGYWAGSNAVISEETTIKVAGSRSLKAVFSGGSGGYIRYPSTRSLDRIIDTYDDIFFWLRTTSIGVTITIRLYDKDGEYEEETISPRQADVGQYFWIDINEMTDTLDWDDDYLQYFEIRVTGDCTIYLDNFCFADEWAYTAPAGLFHTSVADNISTQSPPSENYPFYVTYGYDPFLASVPSEIAEAAEWMAGIYIIDYLRGIRYRQTSFEVWGQTLELDTDSSREGLLGVRTKMEKNYWRCLSDWGGGPYGVI